MKLSCDLVQTALVQQFAGSEIAGGGTFELRRPLLWSEDQLAQAGGIYITDKTDARLARNDILTVYASNAGKNARGCCVRTSAGTVQLLNYIQQLFDRYDACEQQLAAITLRRGSLVEVLNVAREMLINPLIVLNSEFSLVAQSGGELLSDVEYAGTALKTDVAYTRHCDEPEPFLFGDALLGQRFWSIHIDGLPTSHYLLLTENVISLKAGDGALLEFLRPHIRAALLRDRLVGATDDKLRDLLMQALTDRGADYLQLSEQLTRLGWQESHSYFCIVLRLIRRENQGLSIQQICARLRQRYDACCPLLYRDEIVCFFDTTLLGKSLEEIARELTLFIRDELLNVGYSRSMQGHTWLRRQFIQAEAALEIGSRLHPHSWIHHFDSVSLHFLLDEATHRLPGEMICHPGLLELRAHDAENGTEYARTLQVYLENNLNAVHSARALFIHRSTFIHRMERIMKILDSSLDNPMELTYLAISFMLLQDNASE